LRWLTREDQNRCAYEQRPFQGKFREMRRSDQSWGLCEALEFPSQAELNCYLEQGRRCWWSRPRCWSYCWVVCGRACGESHSRDGCTNTFHQCFHSFFPVTILLPIRRKFGKFFSHPQNLRAIHSEIDCVNEPFAHGLTLREEGQVEFLGEPDVCELPFGVPQTPSTFHPRAQRNVRRGKTQRTMLAALLREFFPKFAPRFRSTIRFPRMRPERPWR
jgi:hypothetical protein